MSAFTLTHPGASLTRSGRLSQERLAGLFDDHHQRLYRLACRLCLDAEEARDLVQETYLRAARRPASVPQEPGGAEAWLVRVLVNLSRDRRRRQRVREREAHRLAADTPEAPSPERQVAVREAVRRALVRLTPRRRAVVALHIIEEIPVRRVAELLGISEVTVRYHLAAARRRLAGMLEGVHP